MVYLLMLFLSAQSLLAADITLDNRIIQLDDFKNTLTTTKKTPGRVKLRTKAYRYETVCTHEVTDSYETTCEDCQQELVCNGSGDDQQCSYVWNCKTYACTKWDTYCVEWAKKYSLKDLLVVLKFGMFGPEKDQKIEMSLPSKAYDDNFSIKFNGHSCKMKLKSKKLTAEINEENCHR